MKNNKMIKYPLILGTIALIAGLLLALVYNVTAPVIEKNKNKRENAIVLEMFGESAKISDISDSLTDEEKEKGIYAVLKVVSGGTYYVYKVNVADAFDGDESSFVVAISSSGAISKLKFTSTGDSYASKYASDSYVNSIKGKNGLSTSSDAVSGATKTGKPIIESINAAIAHQGGVN